MGSSSQSESSSAVMRPKNNRNTLQIGRSVVSVQRAIFRDEMAFVRSVGARGGALVSGADFVKELDGPSLNSNKATATFTPYDALKTRS
jgi:hypothetical protein